MKTEERVAQAQKYLRQIGVDGWLIYDFHQRNHLAHVFLTVPSHAMATRRLFYWIPSGGEAIKIVQEIEPQLLDAWPGEKRTFLSWESLEIEMGALLKGCRKIAMEYSPKNANPYISCIDGGTIDFVRSFGVEVVSSGEFLAYFTAVLDQGQKESHFRAANALVLIVHEVWDWIAEHIQDKKRITEYEVQRKILEHFQKRELVTEALPIVACNAHSADPHFFVEMDGAALIQKGDFLLIDLWAKEKHSRAVYADLTKVAVVAEKPSARHEEIFQIVRKAQKAGISLVRERLSKKIRVAGWEIDRAARKVISDAGYKHEFLHRTGHSIDTALHGSGANLDDLETHDDRPLLPGTCFSVEPGIYLPREFGIRLESDVYIDLDGNIEVTGGEQEEIYPLLKRK